MSLVREFSEHHPKISDNAWCAENAVIIGDVEIGDFSSLWYGSVTRGDVNQIRIGKYSNIQDGAVVHCNGTPSHPTIIEDMVTVGHLACIHGCTLKSESLIGIGASVLNGAIVESKSLVAAGAVVREGYTVPAGHLVAGVPAKVIRPLNEEEQQFMEKQAKHYWHDLAEKYKIKQTK